MNALKPARLVGPLIAAFTLVALTGCYRSYTGAALPVPVRLEAPLKFRLTESVPGGPDRVCEVAAISGTVDRVSADTIFLRQISKISPRQRRTGCVVGVPGFVVADSSAKLQARTAELHLEDGFAAVVLIVGLAVGLMFVLIDF